jgi:hypothetical protein
VFVRLSCGLSSHAIVAFPISNVLLTKEVAHNALVQLARGGRVDSVEQVELLTILLCRLLQIEDADEMGNEIEQEMALLINAALGYLTTDTTNEAIEVNGVVLDMLKYLPLRSANEITNTLTLAEGSADTRVQDACAYALYYARPETNEAWMALERGKESKLEAVRQNVGVVLRRRAQ